MRPPKGIIRPSKLRNHQLKLEPGAWSWPWSLELGLELALAWILSLELSLSLAMGSCHPCPRCEQGWSLEAGPGLEPYKALSGPQEP